MGKKKILAVVTSTRADWGLLSPVCRAMREKADVHIIATNMHLDQRRGATAGEIVADGFEIAAGIPLKFDNDDDLSRAIAMGQCGTGVARALSEMRPDALLLLGDRFEILSAACVAVTLHIPVIHIAGGEVSLGALDNMYRNAITQLSDLHLTATDKCRHNVLNMGASPERVINTGAIGVWNALNAPVASKEELEQYLNLSLDRPTVVLTYHPATLDNGDTPAERFKALLDAIDSFKDLQFVITAPNNDAGGDSILAMIDAYATTHANVRKVDSLGMKRYQGLLRHAVMVLGNSSSGIVEAPSAGVPTVDIGERQRGRESAPSVIHCADDCESITAAMREALSEPLRKCAKKRVNPYYKPDTLLLMREAIQSFLDRQ